MDIFKGWFKRQSCSADENQEHGFYFDLVAMVKYFNVLDLELALCPGLLIVVLWTWKLIE